MEKITQLRQRAYPLPTEAMHNIIEYTYDQYSDSCDFAYLDTHYVDPLLATNNNTIQNYITLFCAAVRLQNMIMERAIGLMGNRDMAIRLLLSAAQAQALPVDADSGPQGEADVPEVTQEE